MSTEILKDFFAHFGVAMLVIIINLVIMFILSLSDELDNEDVYLGGFIINALVLSIALSVLILGE